VIDQKIGKIKVRRGTDSQRVLIPFEEGEVIYSVDKKRIFVGDNTTLGGVPICNKNYIVDSLGFPPILPNDVFAGDIIHVKSDSKTYIVNANQNTFELLLISDAGQSNNLKVQIQDLYIKLKPLTGCLTPPPPPPPPPSKLIWVTQPSDNNVNIGDTITFTASASGDGSISYVWQRVDTLTINTPNFYKNSITIKSVNISDIATYYCVASNLVDSITSKNVILDVQSDYILAEDGTYVLSEFSEFSNWD